MLSLTLHLIFGIVAFFGRTLLQRRRFGTTGFRLLPSNTTAPARVASAAMIVGWGLVVAAVFTDDGARGLPVLAALAGIGLYAVGLVLTLVAQLAMGESWRVGVDPAERTALVVHGPFDVVRNPIFSGMTTALAGLTVLEWSPLALVGLVTLVLGIEAQVRLVEEPYLKRVHGPAYAAYLGRVGRFIPNARRHDRGAAA